MKTGTRQLTITKMKRNLIIAFDAKGKVHSVIHERDADDKGKRIYFAAAKVGKLPKGVHTVAEVKIERETTGIDQAAQKARLDADGASKAAVEES